MIGRILNLGLATSALAIGVALGTSLLMDQLQDIELPPLPKFMECWIAPDETCPQSKIGSLNNELTSMGQKLSDAEQALNGQLVFEEGEKFGNGRVVVVGSVFLAPVTRTGFRRATCWISEDRDGYDPRIAIAEMTRDGKIAPLQVLPADNFGLKVDRQEAERMLSACPWPRV
ncbi:hypothetical protein LCM08_26495 [Salipiger pacificus]|nr:hypothetical protein [Alloyangia pacifica]